MTKDWNSAREIITPMNMRTAEREAYVAEHPRDHGEGVLDRDQPSKPECPGFYTGLGGVKC